MAISEAMTRARMAAFFGSVTFDISVWLGSNSVGNGGMSVLKDRPGGAIGQPCFARAILSEQLLGTRQLHVEVHARRLDKIDQILGITGEGRAAQLAF